MKIIVSPECLRRTSAIISQEAEAYKNDYDEMYQEVEALASFWQGADNQAFASQIQGFLPELNQMYQLMQQYSNFLNQSAQVYEQVQNETIAYARKLIN